MIKARWDDIIPFEDFSDHDREMLGSTDNEVSTVEDQVEVAKESIKGWLDYYFKNKWENQPNYVEVFIEKKALQGVFQPICKKHRVALGACKGYPSLTFLNQAYDRFSSAEMGGQKPIMLYFGDYDTEVYY